MTALLSWYDEPLNLLTDAVLSLRGFCDRLIALDGAYAFTPDAEPASPPGQADAIRMAADAAGIDGVVVQPGRLWAGQIEKRQYLFDLAAGPPADWLLIHDADHELDGDPVRFRAFLAGLPPDVVTIEAQYRTPAVAGRQLTPWHEWLTRETFFTPLLFRALPELRVERHHWWYSGLLQGERVALWGWDDSGGELDGAGLYPPGRHEQTKTFKVRHRCFERPEPLLARQRGLYAARADLVAAAGVEP
ncbi:MAG TPA: hypothetical protein VF731_00925 [Solirubrobacterales bacterium]